LFCCCFQGYFEEAESGSAKPAAMNQQLQNAQKLGGGQLIPN
jgi:hypothetical protein